MEPIRICQVAWAQWAAWTTKHESEGRPSVANGGRVPACLSRGDLGIGSRNLVEAFEMRTCSIFICLLGMIVIIPTVAPAIEGVTCTSGSSQYCASSCSQCSPLGGFSCTGGRCFLPLGVESGDLHWRSPVPQKADSGCVLQRLQPTSIAMWCQANSSAGQ